MKIVDSLLNFNFFSLERCRRTSLFLFLSSSALGKGIGSQLHQAQPGSVIRVIRAEHGEKGMQQFSHDGDYRLQRGFPASHELLKESSQVGLMTYSNQRRHVQSPPQMTTAPSANPRFLVDRGARSKTNWI
jgi:hypothetical protein